MEYDTVLHEYVRFICKEMYIWQHKHSADSIYNFSHFVVNDSAELFSTTVDTMCNSAPTSYVLKCMLLHWNARWVFVWPHCYIQWYCVHSNGQWLHHTMSFTSVLFVELWKPSRTVLMCSIMLPMFSTTDSGGVLHIIFVIVPSMWLAPLKRYDYVNTCWCTTKSILHRARVALCL